MARAERRREPRSRALGAALLAGLLAVSPLAVADVDLDSREQTRLSLARAALLARSNRHAEALDLLRDARSRYAGTDLLPELLLQSFRSARGLGDEFRARYFLTEVMRAGPESAAAAVAGGELGELLAADHRYEEALAAFGTAARAADLHGAPGSDHLRLRAAEIAVLYLDDRARARELLEGVDPGRLEGEDLASYSLVLSRARWESLPTSTFGLEDPNVSALTLDAGDLWVGTWNGGLSRYARSDGTYAVFREGQDSLVASTVRAVCATARHVWVGTDQGLSQYSKALSKWRTVEEFSGKEAMKVQALREVEDRVYAATLGDGLWALIGETWVRIAERELPTAYVTCLAPSSRGLLVGTMDHGVFVVSSDGQVTAAEVWAPGLVSRNITALCEDARGTIWVATYGEGLWEWPAEAGQLRRHGLATRELGDDWVMCIAEASGGLYFGTFGGGASFVDSGGRWTRFGLSDGLGGLDVTVVLSAPGAVYFGTLGSGVSVYHEGRAP